ncbi:ZIP family zinc (Zn2+)-iron (Fe2+) permease [Centipeda periodontii DSM 2778]|uniref:ZIP family zinc (Zn2+)-iron (Fe2+) permease n=1 Tax=Centipeda periodontii DSM 2778 TaxID=888060 RepID=F5RMN4_9FIRM|nr:ZIP family zinc (Zn2+)-iron (Fe2+) permease [Centipeda periodontii DSM 2778]
MFTLTGLSQKCGSLPVLKRKTTGTDCYFYVQGLFVVRFVRETVPFLCVW